MKDIQDVAERQMCCGCGACAYLEPAKYEMIDTLDHGRRPVRRDHAPATEDDAQAMAVCPGMGLSRSSDSPASELIRELLPGWGPVLEVWEGHASDDDIRFAGSSGGAAGAIALACIELEQMHGVLHTKARPDVPYLNQTVMSTTRREVMEATGSRYAPASPCDGLAMIESAPTSCAFIGKPCDVAAATRAGRIRPKLDEKLGLTIAIFCAGTPTTRATLDLLARLGIDDPASLVELRYRGNGWPGDTAATARTEQGYRTERMDYVRSWGELLTNNKQWRCHVCPDHTGEFADISVGDAWHRATGPNEKGRSLVVVRTERGRRIVNHAMAGGYLTLSRAAPSVLPAAQRNLLRGRGAVWGRILGCRLLGAPAPRYRGMPLFRFWWSELTFNEKVRSILGVMRRVLTRRIGRRVTLDPLQPLSPAGRAPRRAGAEHSSAESDSGGRLAA